MANLANITEYISAGFARLDFHRTDSNGLPAGVTGIVTPGAVGVPAGRIRAAKTMNINVPKPDLVPVTGDNVPQGTFEFPSAAVRAFDIAFASDDFVDRDAFQSIHPVNIGDHSFSGRDTLPFQINDILLVGVSNASAKMPGILGLGMYAGVFSTRAHILVQGRTTFAERAAAEYMGSVALNAMDSYPWGQTFVGDASHEGYTQSFIEDWTLAFPVTVHRWTQSTGLNTFFLGETPANTSLNTVLVYDIDTVTGNWMRLTSNVTIDQVNRSLTFVTPPLNGHAIVSWYGYIPS